MTTETKQKLVTLIDSLVDDCHEAQTPQDLFNALVRLEKGAAATLALNSVFPDKKETKK
jgi:hypothetical protein